MPRFHRRRWTEEQALHMNKRRESSSFQRCSRVPTHSKSIPSMINPIHISCWWALRWMHNRGTAQRAAGTCRDTAYTTEQHLESSGRQSRFQFLFSRYSLLWLKHPMGLILFFLFSHTRIRGSFPSSSINGSIVKLNRAVNRMQRKILKGSSKKVSRGDNGVRMTWLRRSSIP